ncbi:MAG: glycosyltransferase family 2 protein [Bacteroidaceae bacterium]|nr:glycosyltransferase family 2 protein [Bacteroidaceae bacterium]
MSKKLSVIMPVYNEAEHIKNILQKVCDVILPDGILMEIVVVNDASSDETAQRVKEFIADNEKCDIRLAEHEVNRGKGAGIRTALQYVTGDYTVIQDGDEELDPNDFVPMLQKMLDENLSVLYGSRFLSHEKRAASHTFYLGNRILALVANILYGQHITDEATCYKMFLTSLLKSIPLECDRFEFCPEVTAKVSRLGYKIQEIPIHYYPRSFEQGKKLRARDGWDAILTLLKYRF